MDRNLLSAETSPYLLQHKDNPVHWQPWGEAALADARATGRPILLSIGYAACHWCHVMAHESFEDPATAAVMNRLYVNIKVDREERPDVDQIYMAALHALGEQGGWPLTMFLTPDGDPVWGGTYFPKTERFGRPGFVDVLEWFAAAHRDQPDRIDASRKALVEHLRSTPDRQQGRITPELLEEASALVARLIDPINGGLNGAPKFPQPTLMEALARSAGRRGTSHPDVTLTLRHIAEGGIYDHIGGGISRYATDEIWLVPHFEKMLYDNALFIERLALQWAATRDGLFRTRIEETVAWLFREMTVEGAFASSLDADSPGGEGAFYVWTPEAITAVLGPERATQFGAVYDVSPGGNFEGASIPNRLSSIGLRGAAEESDLAADRAALLAARERRARPGRDDKILTDWNGLVIAALATAGAVLGHPDWIDQAASAYRFITESMPAGSRLVHSYRDGIRLGLSFATDYAGVLKAALALHQATFDRRYLDDAERWAGELDRSFWDDSVGAYRLTASDATGLITRPLPVLDESVPSANAIIATALVRLGTLTGTRRYADRAEAILTAHLSGPRDVLGKAGLFNALDQFLGTVEIVIVGLTGQGDLVAAVRRRWRDAFVLSLVPDASTLPSGHPAYGKSTLEGRATAFVCRGQTCSLPVTSADDLVALLG